MKVQALFVSLISAFSALSAVSADSIVIEDWDVSLYLQSDGNATARAFLGETVSWIGATSQVVQFKDDEDYYACNFTNATNATLFDVPGNVYETWPEGVNWKKTDKGAQYFATEDGCELGEKIKIIVSPKQYTRDKRNVCSEGTVLQELASFKGGKGKCKKRCDRNRECLGFQWTKNKKLRGCTLYSDYPVAGGGKGGNKKVFCATVKLNNTVVEEEED